MKTSVVIPTYNNWDLTFQLIRDLFYNTSWPDEVLVVDNGSKTPRNVYDYPVREIKIAENVGFVVASNVGMQQARGEILFLISNDVRVHGDIITEAKTLYEQNADNRIIMAGKVYWGDTGWNNFDGRIFPYAEGWLLACRKAAWQEIGGFDPRYSPYDFEDVDFSTSALEHGYQLVPFLAGAVDHLVARTIGYSPEREKITIEHREIFKQKWLTK